MRVPVIEGVIERRILANYRIDPEVMAAALPTPFRPKVVHGHAIGGICLIRLVDVKPKSMPWMCGIRSENAAHRIAVEWDVDGEAREGVYIPRRDTDSHLNALVGGTLFPGIHHLATFDVTEDAERFSVALRSDDGDTRVAVAGSVGEALAETSVFRDLAEVSSFFEAGSLGYSETGDGGRYDGLELACRDWRVEALDVDHVASSYFEDATRFPPGSVAFDCALLMRDIAHEWHSRDDLCA